MAAGTLLYTTMLHILPEVYLDTNREHGHHHHHHAPVQKDEEKNVSTCKIFVSLIGSTVEIFLFDRHQSFEKFLTIDFAFLGAIATTTLNR